MSKYVIRLTSRIDSEKHGYYSAKEPWQTVMKCAADRLTHKEAYKIRNSFSNPRLGYTATVVEVEELRRGSM